MDMKPSPSEKSIQNINICIWVEGEIFTYMLLYKILWNDKKKSGIKTWRAEDRCRRVNFSTF